MTHLTLSQPAMSVIDGYLKFRVGNATCSIPYFNNKTTRARAALAVHIGKGNPTELQDELMTLTKRDGIDISSLTDKTLKELLISHNLGIDCSGFAYHVLNAESVKNTARSLNKKLFFTGGILNKLRSRIRPVENSSVAIFADNHNSMTISLSDVRPGDFISITDAPEGNMRDHILIIHAVDYTDSIPTIIHYSHSIAYPEDGLYNTGVRQAQIKITDIKVPLTQAIWAETKLSHRLQISKVELRRLR